MPEAAPKPPIGARAGGRGRAQGPAIAKKSAAGRIGKIKPQLISASLGRQTTIVYITHLKTERNSQTKKPSVTLSAVMRNLPSSFRLLMRQGR